MVGNGYDGQLRGIGGRVLISADIQEECTWIDEHFFLASYILLDRCLVQVEHWVRRRTA